jgi:hypothetical protein
MTIIGRLFLIGSVIVSGCRLASRQGFDRHRGLREALADELDDAPRRWSAHPSRGRTHEDAESV